jgi:hypothetical protein
MTGGAALAFGPAADLVARLAAGVALGRAARFASVVGALGALARFACGLAAGFVFGPVAGFGAAAGLGDDLTLRGVAGFVSRLTWLRCAEPWA